MVVTDKTTFSKYAANYPLVPVGKRIPADTETPVSTYLKTAKTPWSFLLESVEGGAKWGRYSLVGFDPFLILEARGRETLITVDGKTVRANNPIEEIRSLIAKNRLPKIEGFPRFAGGMVGYLGYGTARLFEELPPRKEDPADLPDIKLFAPRKLLAFDNARKTLDVIVLADAKKNRAYDLAMEEIEEILQKLRQPLPAEVIFPPKADPVKLEPVIAKEKFKAMVSEVREAIHSGEAIQVVLSQPFEGKIDLDPFTVYRALRTLNPSPYLFHLNLGEEILVGGSPEVMVRVEDGRGLVRPIAGTRHRGATLAEDLALEKELLADAKERAEHVMLVDLGRNDLGRVAKPGAVKLEESFIVEKYSHVMHLVSTVSADLREGVDCLDVFGATFPAGTVSGAPKVRAMELIADLEPRERGYYAGAVGYIGFDGNLDTCIAIRTMLFHQGKVFLQAGAGIVADSNPTKEYEETLHKAQALMKALEIAAKGLSE